MNVSQAKSWLISLECFHHALAVLFRIGDYEAYNRVRRQVKEASGCVLSRARLQLEASDNDVVVASGYQQAMRDEIEVLFTESGQKLRQPPGERKQPRNIELRAREVFSRLFQRPRSA